MDLFSRLKPQVARYFQKARGSHDWEHTARVLALAEHLARAEKADMQVVKLAALLHDIARPDEDQRQGLVCHARQGAKQAQALLEELGAPAPLIAEVVHCIRAHRFRGRHHPESPEARILFDADKLDAIGAVGIGRAFLFAGEVGARLHNKGIDLEHTRAYSREDTAYREYWVKLRFIKDRMLTAEGRRMARQRHVFMQAFFDQLDKEVEGLR